MGGSSVGVVNTPYRNELDALRERKGSLEQELATLRQQTSELEGLRSREQELEKELACIAQKLGAGATRRALPLLEQVRVASPCNASWDEMVGDERVRFCLSCEKNVYNLSAMPREDAERLLEERLGKDLCVRFYQRADGTILTEDCPVGVRKKRRKKLALAVAGAGAMAFAATSMLTRGTCHVQGEVAMPTQGVMAPEPFQGKATAAPDEGNGTWEMGDKAAPAPSVMGTAAPLPQVRMGGPAVIEKRAK